MKCTATGAPYTVFGYKGKQVRDNIHSADLVRAFYEFYKAPRAGEVYNIGGGRFSNCSMLEAIDLSQEIAGREVDWSYAPANRIGRSHLVGERQRQVRRHYPDWHMEYDIPGILREIHDGILERRDSELVHA
jgi:CDP-paratose 2-epimerase